MPRAVNAHFVSPPCLCCCAWGVLFSWLLLAGVCSPEEEKAQREQYPFPVRVGRGRRSGSFSRGGRQRKVIQHTVGETDTVQVGGFEGAPLSLSLVFAGLRLVSCWPRTGGGLAL